jgi:hypothetical protein
MAVCTEVTPNGFFEELFLCTRVAVVGIVLVGLLVVDACGTFDASRGEACGLCRAG